MNRADQRTADSIEREFDVDTLDARVPSSGAERRHSILSRLGHVGSRIVYWLPVFAAMILFAQMSFFGLRPALSEERRLADAEVTLAERERAALAMRATIAPQLQARNDPIFRERQRRLRQAELLARPEELARREVEQHRELARREVEQHRELAQREVEQTRELARRELLAQH